MNINKFRNLTLVLFLLTIVIGFLILRDSTRRIVREQLVSKLRNIYLPLIAKSQNEIQAQGLQKGIASCCGTTCADMQNLGIGWYYSWWPTPPGVPCGEVEFVPMFRDEDQLAYITYTLQSMPNLKHVLGYNEPNIKEPAGSQMSLTQLIDNWSYLSNMIPITVNLIGPSLYEWSGQSYGFKDFLDAYISKYGTRPRLDMAAVHWYRSYDNSMGKFGPYLDNYRNTLLQYGYPVGIKIWLTEWGFQNASSLSQWQLENDLNEYKKQIKLRPWVVSWSYFSGRLDGQLSMKKSALVDGNGNLTSLGSMYREW